MVFALEWVYVSSAGNVPVETILHRFYEFYKSLTYQHEIVEAFQMLELLEISK